MRQQTTTAITYGILALAGAVPMTMPSQLTPSSASASAQAAATLQIALVPQVCTHGHVVPAHDAAKAPPSPSATSQSTE